MLQLHLESTLADKRHININISNLNLGQRLNMTNSSDEPRNELEDLLVVTCWALLAGFGLITNLLILFGIFTNLKFRRSTSYWLIMSLAVCDISMLLVSLGHLVPSTALQERYVGVTDFGNAFGIFVYDAFWYTGVLHLILMALNRYINICRPKMYLKIFSNYKTLAAMFVAYILGILIAVPGLFECCYLVFNFQMYAAQYEPADTPYTYLDLAVNATSIVVMTFCYTCIVLRVRRSRIMLTQYKRLCREQSSHHVVNSQNLSKFARLLRPTLTVTSRREVRLFFQFATVSVIFFLSFATWNWLPRLSGSKWVGLVVTSLFFLNNSTNPTVYLLFNAALRKHLKKLICICKFADTRHSNNANVWMELKEGTENATFGRNRYYSHSINKNNNNNGANSNPNNNNNNNKSFRNTSLMYSRRLVSKRKLKRMSSGGDDGTSVTDSPCNNLTAITALFNSTALTASVLMTTDDSRDDGGTEVHDTAGGTVAATKTMASLNNFAYDNKCNVVDNIEEELDDEDLEDEEEEEDEDDYLSDQENKDGDQSDKELESPSVHL